MGETQKQSMTARTTSFDSRTTRAGEQPGRSLTASGALLTPAQYARAVDAGDRRWHDLLPDQPCERTAGGVYVRFHGPDAVENRYRGRYASAGLASWIDRLRPVLADGDDVFAYFNNDYDGHAVADATTLLDALRPGHA